MRTFTLIVPALLALALSACKPDAPASAKPEMIRVEAPSSDPTEFVFAELGVVDLQERMQRGELDSRTLTRAYLDRIAAIDRAGPKLRSVIATNPKALDEAAQRDAERRAGKVRGPLHGIPILIKDNIDATPMANTAGSLALKDFRPQTDAFLVRRLREAGAVILGKANLSEWANIRSTRSSSGWSAVGGQTRNPYVLNRNPCGSSSGSAVAVAANLTAAAIGTETDGSIICPASVNGIVGLKPTVGLISRDGIIPISHSQDTAGPMARNVSGVALLLTAMAGRDEADSATHGAALNAPLDYYARLKPDGLKGARIGVLRNKQGIHPDAAAALERAIQTMREAGATVVDAEIPTDGQWGEDELNLLLYELKSGLQRYFAKHPNAPAKSLADVIEFNKRNAAKEMRFFGQELFEMAETKGGLDSPDYIAARNRARRLAGPEGIDAALKAQKLDALIAPATGPAWVTDLVNGDHFSGEGYGAAAVAGYPSLTVPMGHSNGLPLGIVFMGTAWSEPRLIELGYAYEQLTRARRPPKYLRKLPGHPAQPTGDKKGEP